MPSVFETNAVYLQSGDPTTENNTKLMEPGQLGVRFSMQYPTGRGAPPLGTPRTLRLQVVQVDPAAPAATKAGQPVYWTDKSTYKVTTAGGTNLNALAGVCLAVGVLAGNYTVIVIGGPASVRASDANVTAAVAGDMLVGGATDLAVLVAQGTAPSTVALGVISTPKTTDTSGGTGNQRILCDVNVVTSNA